MLLRPGTCNRLRRLTDFHSQTVPAEGNDDGFRNLVDTRRDKAMMAIGAAAKVAF